MAARLGWAEANHHVHEYNKKRQERAIQFEKTKVNTDEKLEMNNLSYLVTKLGINAVSTMMDPTVKSLTEYKAAHTAELKKITEARK